MSYTPTNVYAYVAAYSGAIAGMAVSGWIVDPVAADYASVTAIAGAFAQEFDTVWNSATQLTFLEIQSIQSVVAQEFSQRGPGPLANASFQNPTTWQRPAAACAALVLQSDAYVAGQGITPPSPGSGAGSQVSVNAQDTTSGFLAQKLVAGTSIALTVVNPGGNEQLRIDLLTAFAVTGFATPTTLVLAGASVVSPSFTASYNQAATAANLTDSDGDNDVIALPATAFVSPHTFTKNVYGQFVTFTIHATGPAGTGSATASVSISWGQNVYFGSAVDPGGGGYTNAFITGLAAQLMLAPNGSYNFNALAGQSTFWAARSAFGLTVANFFVGGFPFACSKVATVAVTNANGVTENYDLFRSDNTGLGAFTMVEQ